ncbi:hypothetical protein [Vibrio maritimus]|uniref:hypothetical protein n=1 Tax=Vibrio maritimus TaxID=990268 RepID=UPI003734E369
MSSQNSARQRLVDEIDKKTKLISSNDLLHQLVEHQKESKSEQHDFSALIKALQTIADKPGAITAEQFQSISELRTTSVEHAVGQLQRELVTALGASKINEDKFAAELVEKLTGALHDTIGQPIANGLSRLDSRIAELAEDTVTLEMLTTSLNNQVKQPLTSKLEELVVEHRQTNQGIFAMTEVIGTLTDQNTNHLTQDQLSLALQTEVRNPIVTAIDEAKVHSQQTVDGVSRLEDKLSVLDVLLEVCITQDDLGNALTTHIEKPLVGKLNEIAAENRQTNQGVYAISEELSAISNQNSSLLNEEQLISAMRTELQLPLVSSINETKRHAYNTELGIEKLFSSSESVVEGLDRLSKSRMDEFEHLVKKMGVEIVEPITSELHDTNKAVTQFAAVSDDLNLNVVASIAKLEETTEKVVEFEERTLTKLDDFTESMDRSLNEFAENSTKALTAISGEVKAIVELGSISIEQQTSAFSQMITDSEAMFQRQADTLKVVGQESAGLMSAARQELESGLGDIDSKVLNMSFTVQKELERFRTDYQTNLNQYFNEQTRLLDVSLNEQKSGLNEVIENFKGVFEEEYTKRSSLLNDLDEQYVKLAQAAERVQAMAKSLGLENAEWVGQLQLVNNSIGRQVADLGKAYAQSSAQFSQLAEQMRPEMDDYFKRANRSVEEYFSAFDATSHRIYSRLDRAVDLMSTMIEEVQNEKAQLAEKVELSA